MYIIKVSGSGGNMSGSFLDALIQQRKYQIYNYKYAVNETFSVFFRRNLTYSHDQPRQMIPQAILFPAFPAGWEIKSSGLS